MQLSAIILKYGKSVCIVVFTFHLFHSNFGFTLSTKQLVPTVCQTPHVDEQKNLFWNLCKAAAVDQFQFNYSPFAVLEQYKALHFNGLLPKVKMCSTFSNRCRENERERTMHCRATFCSVSCAAGDKRNWRSFITREFNTAKTFTDHHFQISQHVITYLQIFEEKIAT